MADALRTITIDTANSPWVKIDGKTTTVSGVAQTFQIYLYDLGTTATFAGAGANQDVLLSDGTLLKFTSDKKLVHIGDALADATAKANPGSLWVSENGGPEVEVKVTTITIADVDATGADNLTTITFEYPGKPWKWSWATLNIA
jgi:hypothetical protein